LKLQALLDGELPGREAREILAWTQRDAEAAALLVELRSTREAMVKSDLQLSLPETREFFWSKIEREIRKCPPEEISETDFNWRRLLWPISLAAGAIAVCFFAVISQNPVADKPAQGAAVSTAAISSDADTPDVESAQADSEAMTYEDKSDGTTLVWFSADENSATAKTF
jgi:anti-sigma factor RsiW